jgi:hypothetical protein
MRGAAGNNPLSVFRGVLMTFWTMGFMVLALVAGPTEPFNLKGFAVIGVVSFYFWVTTRAFVRSYQKALTQSVADFLTCEFLQTEAASHRPLLHRKLHGGELPGPLHQSILTESAILCNGPKVTTWYQTMCFH